MSATESAERRAEPIDAEFEPADRHGRRQHGGIGLVTALGMSTVAALAGGAIGLIGPRTALVGLADRVAPNDLSQVRIQQGIASRELAQTSARLKGIESSGGLTPEQKADLDGVGKGLSAVERKLANLEIGLKLLPGGPEETQVLQRRIAALESLPTDPTSASPEQLARATAGLLQRVAFLESRTQKGLEFESAAAGFGIDPSSVGQRLAALQTNVKDLQTKLADSASTADVAALSADLKKMQDELPQIAEGATRAASAARAAYAVAAATDASRASGSFEQAYTALQSVLPDDPNVVALGPLSRRGAPTRMELRDSFLRSELSIIRAAQEAQVGGGIWGKLQAMLAQFVTIRRSGEIDTPTGAVERAEKRLNADDLGGAIAELSRLTGPAAQVCAPWLTQARLRLEIDTRLAAVRAELARKG